MLKEASPAERLRGELERLRGPGDPAGGDERRWADLFAFFLANAPDFIALVGLDGRYLFLNKVLTPRTVEDVIGTSIYDHQPPEGREKLRERMEQVLRTREPSRFEFSARLSNGRAAYFETRIAPLLDGEQVVAFAMLATDVTERRRLEEQLHQSQKMEAIGQLTAGIAHNFNNMLMGILPNIEMAMQRVSDDVRPLLSEAEQAARRAADLVRQLMTFAGGRGVRARERQALGPLVEEAVAICRKAFDRTIKIDILIDPALGTLSVDGTEIEQALMNVLINARDAILELKPAAPRIVVDVARVEAGASEITRQVDTQRVDHARVRITDNGIGMRQDTIARIYEPFFTTKEPGHGTGLGLATVHAIVHAHGGWVSCESEPGRGTIFSLYFPCEKGPAPVVAPATQPVEIRAEGTETILVVDDEPYIRRAMGAMLSGVGYTVHLAASGNEALRLLDEGAWAADVALVLLDVSMPGIPGRELLPRIRERLPRARIVYFSGYALDAPAEGADGVLEKPIAMGPLLRAVRDVLDRPRNAGT